MRRNGKPPGAGTAPAGPGQPGRPTRQAVEEPQPAAGDLTEPSGELRAGEVPSGEPPSEEPQEAAGAARDPESGSGPAGRPGRPEPPDRVPWLIALAVFAA